MQIGEEREAYILEPDAPPVPALEEPIVDPESATADGEPSPDATERVAPA